MFSLIDLEHWLHAIGLSCRVPKKSTHSRLSESIIPGAPLRLLADGTLVSEEIDTHTKPGKLKKLLFLCRPEKPFCEENLSVFLSYRLEQDTSGRLSLTPFHPMTIDTGIPFTAVPSERLPEVFELFAAQGIPADEVLVVDQDLQNQLKTVSRTTLFFKERCEIHRIFFLSIYYSDQETTLHRRLDEIEAALPRLRGLFISSDKAFSREVVERLQRIFRRIIEEKIKLEFLSFGNFTSENPIVLDE